MHYADIIAALIKAGHPPVKVAGDLKVSRSTVSQIIRGTGTSRRIAKHISKKTRIPLNQLWPDGRYGRRKSRRAAA